MQKTGLLSCWRTVD